MTDAYTGEIRIFAGAFAPSNWMFSDGQLLAISSEQALFSLLGTLYGGDGRSSFGVPDMRGRIPMHQGTGPGLTPRPIGQRAGTETVVLTDATIPVHNHNLQCSLNSGSRTDPTSSVPAKVADDQKLYDTDLDPVKLKDMAQGIVASTGNNIGHQNMMPWLGINFIMCRNGVYPSRN